ncbi:UNVERIFIED_CONTAM: hypothetical protein HDU68_006330 [Siphonaria sp. JEL0065]|nr:hypothetical protein HDU68_006330 [Siphonaria sp. JEL0065]
MSTGAISSLENLKTTTTAVVNASPSNPTSPSAIATSAPSPTTTTIVQPPTTTAVIGPPSPEPPQPTTATTFALVDPGNNEGNDIIGLISRIEGHVNGGGGNNLVPTQSMQVPDNNGGNSGNPGADLNGGSTGSSHPSSRVTNHGSFANPTDGSGSTTNGNNQQSDALSSLSGSTVATISIASILALVLIAFGFLFWKKSRSKQQSLPRHQPECLNPESPYFASGGAGPPINAKKLQHQSPPSPTRSLPQQIRIVIDSPDIHDPPNSPASSADTLAEPPIAPLREKENALFANVPRILATTPSPTLFKKSEGLFDQMKAVASTSSSNVPPVPKRVDTVSARKPFNQMLNNIAAPTMRATTAMRLKSKAFFARDGPHTKPEPASPEEWTVQEAAVWVNVNGGGVEGAAIVLDQEINGRVLTTVPVEELLSVIPCKTLGERVKLRDSLIILRGSVEDGAVNPPEAYTRVELAPPKYEDE